MGTFCLPGLSGNESRAGTGTLRRQTHQLSPLVQEPGGLGRRKTPVSTLSSRPPVPREPEDAPGAWHRRSEPRRAEGGGLGAEADRGQVEPVPSLPSRRRGDPPSSWQGPELLLPGRPHLLGRRQDVRKAAPICRPGVVGSAKGPPVPVDTGPCGYPEPPCSHTGP